MKAVQIVNPFEMKVALAKLIGAFYVINSKAENVHERMRELLKDLVRMS